MKGFPISRRRFISGTASTPTILALGGAGINALAQKARAAANPFAYDIERFGRTDPRLIRYEQVAGFPSGAAQPRRIKVGEDGRFYIAGSTGVIVIDANGSLVSKIALASPAQCIAVAAEGSVFVGLQDHIEVFDREGARQQTWEVPGKKTWLTAVALGESDLFAADSGNRVILRYDRSGKLVGRIGEKNKERNIPGFIVPSPYLDVVAGKDGLLRVNNPGRHRVELYTVEGDYELAWGKPSAGIEGFCGCCNPVALAMLPDGSCVTCEKGLPRVKVYSGQGAFESVVAGPETFPDHAGPGRIYDASDCTLGGLDAAVDKSGRVCVLDLVSSEVRIFKRKASSS
jgi:hypothetical protein